MNYTKSAIFYAKSGYKMMIKDPFTIISDRFYLFGSRPLTHIGFWLSYYLAFSLIWMRPEVGYFGAFFLEFILLPARILAVYGMIYLLMPKYLLTKRFRAFFLGYAALLLMAGLIQVLAHHYFYQRLFLNQPGSLWDLAALVRAILLVNSTVIFVGAIRLLQLYLALQKQLDHQRPFKVEIKANRRTHLVNVDNILYLEGMGNYVSYHLANGTKLVAHGSIKNSLAGLPNSFVRLHKSYVINTDKIEAFNSEDVFIGQTSLPRGKDISDQMLLGEL